jgi:hypothetical protein
MDSRQRLLKIAALALCIFLLAINGMSFAATEGQTETQSEKPVTDCYESRDTYTTVTRIENAVPQYGLPNIKCSKTTGAVLWYGDPFDATIPMGEMPELKDSDTTHGNFVNAVVKPREPHLMYFNMGPDGCKTCHDGKTVPFPKNKKPRLLAMHQDIVENSLELQHGREALWCLDCHSAKNRNKLVNRQGVEISFNQPQRLCGTCHGEKYIDWRAGVHGKRTGSWVSHEGKKRWWVCTECHNPHTVQKNRFNPIRPEPAPPLPRGMNSANYERLEHDAH